MMHIMPDRTLFICMASSLSITHDGLDSHERIVTIRATQIKRARRRYCGTTSCGLLRRAARDGGGAG